MYVEDDCHVLCGRQSLPWMYVSVRDVSPNLRSHLLVQVQGVVSIELDKSHGDKQSITIVLGAPEGPDRRTSRRGEG
jgi:hypothetical protein